MRAQPEREALLRQLLDVHRELASVASDDFPTKHVLLSRVDELRDRLAALPIPLTPDDRALIKEELRALRNLRVEYATINRELRWGQSVPVWLFWRRFRQLSLQDRPSFPVTRRPGRQAAAKPWTWHPNWMQFEPELGALNERISQLEDRLRPRRRFRSRVRRRRRHVHPDDAAH